MKRHQSAREPWLRYMLEGNFEPVWRMIDQRLAEQKGPPDRNIPRHLQQIWSGDSLEGKRVLVRCYHGLGDTVQFIRYMSLLKQTAAYVMVWGQAELIPLLKHVEGVDWVLPLNDSHPEIEYDVDIELMECPYIFRTVLQTIPAEVPYLSVSGGTVPMAVCGKLAVGLVWKAGNWDPRRSIPFSLLSPLFEVSGISWYILQENPVAAGWKAGQGVYPGRLELSAYAGFMKGLDLMISVDSMPVHLAGALAIPVWNLLHAEADWRWMREREDSPWYPTMRLFRQPRLGHWEPVIRQVALALERLRHSSAAPAVSSFH